MELYEKNYPYPVLLPNGDDYVGCSFDVNVNPMVAANEISFQLETKLVCPEISAAINHDEASIIIHVECSQSAYRKSFPIQIGLYRTPPISTNDLSGRVTVCPFIVAKRDIKGFRSEYFNRVYDKLSFNIHCGAVLAVGAQAIVYADTITRDIDFKPDIFSVVPYDPTPDDCERIKIDPSSINQKIRIDLPRNTFLQYNALLKCGEAKEFLWSAIVLPAIMQALYTMQRIIATDGNFGDYEECAWCQRLIERIEFLHPQAKSDRCRFFESMDVPKIAQELIYNPIAMAVSKLASFGGTGEGEDEN